MGQALRFAPLLSACMRKALGGPIQTILPAFDGLKVFPSLAGLSIARFDFSLFQACQPAGVPAHRVVRTFLTVRRVTGSHSTLRFHWYLWSLASFDRVPRAVFSNYIFNGLPTLPIEEAIVLLHHYFSARMPMNSKFRQIGSISRKPTCRNACLSSASVQSVISPRRLRSLSRSSFSLNPCSNL
jgi:hypothetical protein